MILSVHQPQYIPWLGYFDKIGQSDIFVFLDKVQYKRREYQNRNRICTKEGCIWLSVPVALKGLGRPLINEVKIDNSSNWPKKHFESLKRCYNRAAFFKEHSDFFEDVYLHNQWEKLIELNVHIIKYILQAFKITTPLYYESEIGTSSLATERIVEVCQKLKADTYLSGAGGKDYLEEDKFFKSGIKLVYQNFNHPHYRQQYEGINNPFKPYMSSIDLLFNQGEKSNEYISHRFASR